MAIAPQRPARLRAASEAELWAAFRVDAQTFLAQFLDGLRPRPTREDALQALAAAGEALRGIRIGAEFLRLSELAAACRRAEAELLERLPRVGDGQSRPWPQAQAVVAALRATLGLGAEDDADEAVAAEEANASYPPDPAGAALQSRAQPLGPRPAGVAPPRGADAAPAPTMGDELRPASPGTDDAARPATASPVSLGAGNEARGATAEGADGAFAGPVATAQPGHEPAARASSRTAAPGNEEPKEPCAPAAAESPRHDDDTEPQWLRTRWLRRGPWILALPAHEAAEPQRATMWAGQGGASLAVVDGIAHPALDLLGVWPRQPEGSATGAPTWAWPLAESPAAAAPLLCSDDDPALPPAARVDAWWPLPAPLTAACGVRAAALLADAGSAERRLSVLLLDPAWLRQRLSGQAPVRPAAAGGASTPGEVVPTRGASTCAPAPRRWLRIRAGGRTWALDADSVRLVLDAPSLAPLPLATPVLPGLVAWQGRAVLVADLGARLGEAPSARRSDWRLLLWSHGRRVGAWAVDAVDEILTLSALQICRHWAPARAGLPPPWNALEGVLYGDGQPGWPDEPIAAWDGPRLWALCLEAAAVDASPVPAIARGGPDGLGGGAENAGDEQPTTRAVLAPTGRDLRTLAERLQLLTLNLRLALSRVERHGRDPAEIRRLAVDLDTIHRQAEALLQTAAETTPACAGPHRRAGA